MTGIPLGPLVQSSVPTNKQTLKILSMDPTVVTNRPIPSGGVAIIATNAVFLFLAILAVIARFYARHIQNKKYGLDDYFIVAGLVCIIYPIHRMSFNGFNTLTGCLLGLHHCNCWSWFCA